MSNTSHTVALVDTTPRSTAETVHAAIDESTYRTATVDVAWSTDAEAELLVIADGSWAHDYWGVDPDGAEWRIRLVRDGQVAS